MLFGVGGWKWFRGCLIVRSSMKSPRPHLIYCSLWTSSRNLENISVRKHETRRTKTKRRTGGELKRDMLQISLKRNCLTSGITVWCTLPWLLEKLFLKQIICQSGWDNLIDSRKMNTVVWVVELMYLRVVHQSIPTAPCPPPLTWATAMSTKTRPKAPEKT